MSAYNAFMVKIHELNTENAQLRAEITKLRAERENLLALLKAAREHHRRCLGDMARIDGDPPIPNRDVTDEDFEEWEKKHRARIRKSNLGPPLERCSGIETP